MEYESKYKAEFIKGSLMNIKNYNLSTENKIIIQTNLKKWQ